MRSYGRCAFDNVLSLSLSFSRVRTRRNRTFSGFNRSARKKEGEIEEKKKNGKEVG
jgi:hypothetical protein